MARRLVWYGMAAVFPAAFVAAGVGPFRCGTYGGCAGGSNPFTRGQEDRAEHRASWVSSDSGSHPVIAAPSLQPYLPAGSAR